MPEKVAGSTVLRYFEFCQRRRSEMLDLLRRLVEIESPSFDKGAVDELGRLLKQEFERRGGRVKVHPVSVYGDHLQVEFAGGRPGKPVLLLGHFDTVWSMGSLASMPFRVEAGHAFGPGVLDMKSGIVMMMFAVQALAEAGAQHRPVTIFLDTDEEVGSHSSRSITEAIAQTCEVVLVLEPAQGPRGFVKTSRKGVGDYTIRVRGRAAHAGVDFEKGHSAILELARQILEVSKFTDLSTGVTVNPGVVQGGTRTNVIAAQAQVDVDVRVARMTDAADLEKKFSNLRPFDPDCRLEVSGGVNRPPMERGPGTIRLLELAQDVARELGIELGESATGGGSDGNFTAALGLPTLDGLGAVGEGAHASSESIVIEEFLRRTAVLAALIQRI